MTQLYLLAEELLAAFHSKLLACNIYFLPSAFCMQISPPECSEATAQQISPSLYLVVYLSFAASSSSRVKPREFCAQGSAPVVHSRHGRGRVWAGGGGEGHGLCQEQGEKPWMPWNVHIPSLQGHREAHGETPPSSGVGVTLGKNLQLVLTVGTLRF